MVNVDRADNAALLKEHVEQGSESALAELIRRHADLVYSAALRRCNGDSAMAEDITQKVFADFAAKARSLPNGLVLAGWLYRHTTFVATTVIRSESRRRRREQEFARMNTQHHHPDPGWTQIAPVLEEAMQELGDRDRDALLLRFFQEQPLREVGAALGVSEDAARMRVDRAMERLREKLQHRGITSSVAVLTGLLAANAVTTCPAALVASLSAGALAVAPSAVSTVKLFTIMTLTKSQAVAAGALILAGVAVPAWQYQHYHGLEAENASLRQLGTQLSQARQDNQQLSAQITELTKAHEAQQAELAKLRGRVTTLKRVEQDNSRLKAQIQKSGKSQPGGETAKDEDEQEDPTKQLGIAKLNFSKLYGLALIMYAQDHNDLFPTNFAAVASYLPNNKDIRADSEKFGIQEDQYDLVYHGALKDITEPARTIVMQEKEAFQTPGGKWAKTYLFADGHTEIHSAPPDGDFGPWEKEHSFTTLNPRTATAAPGTSP